MEHISKVGPIAALTLLQLNIEGKCKLTHDEIEELLDSVFDGLTDIRNELKARAWAKAKED